MLPTVFYLNISPILYLLQPLSSAYPTFFLIMNVSQPTHPDQLSHSQTIHVRIDRSFLDRHAMRVVPFGTNACVLVRSVPLDLLMKLHQSIESVHQRAT